MIKVLFFASLREKLGCEQLEVPSEQINNIQQLLTYLYTLHPSFEKAFTESILVAVNQNMVTKSHALSDGDEVAFFPPVTGG